MLAMKNCRPQESIQSFTNSTTTSPTPYVRPSPPRSSSINSLWCQLLIQGQDHGQSPLSFLHQSQALDLPPSVWHLRLQSKAVAPLGTPTIIYEPKTQRKNTFASHGVLGWYIDPALDHYHNYKIYVPATRDTRFGKIVQFLPSTFPVPATSSADKASLLVEDLIHEQQHHSFYPSQTDPPKQLHGRIWPRPLCYPNHQSHR